MVPPLVPPILAADLEPPSLKRLQMWPQFRMQGRNLDSNRDSWYDHQKAENIPGLSAGTTGLGKRVVPRLRELAAPRPEGVGMRDSRNLFCPALYDISRK